MSTSLLFEELRDGLSRDWTVFRSQITSGADSTARMGELILRRGDRKLKVSFPADFRRREYPGHVRVTVQLEQGAS